MERQLKIKKGLFKAFIYTFARQETGTQLSTRTVAAAAACLLARNQHAGVIDKGQISLKGPPD